MFCKTDHTPSNFLKTVLLPKWRAINFQTYSGNIYTIFNIWVRSRSMHYIDTPACSATDTVYASKIYLGIFKSIKYYKICICVLIFFIPRVIKFLRSTNLCPLQKSCVCRYQHMRVNKKWFVFVLHSVPKFNNFFDKINFKRPWS